MSFDEKTRRRFIRAMNDLHKTVHRGHEPSRAFLDQLTEAAAQKKMLDQRAVFAHIAEELVARAKVIREDPNQEKVEVRKIVIQELAHLLVAAYEGSDEPT